MLRYTLRNPATKGFPRPDGMPEALHRLLVARGVGSLEEAAAFLNPRAEDLADPLALHDMGAAAERLRAAIAAGEAICVYGDYDVDGVCASAILSGYLKEQGADARVYLPSRHSEGYGLNEGAIRGIAGWAKLLVTVDCGVTSVELAALAKELGLDVIVTDHHMPAEELPDCPVVDPLLGDYPFPHLCGAGVAWKLVWALGGAAAALPWIDVAALATVADVVPLTGENRVIVRLGLDAMNRAPRPGIAALIESAGLAAGAVTSTGIAFQLAPRLNAGGRLGSARRSLDLVLAADMASARPLAAELEAENARRKAVEQQILREAEAQLSDFDFAAHRALILSGKDWNPGVIGLAASRLVEKYHYPVVLLADQGDRLTGSCRSIEGVDIHAALTGCAGTIEKFGGHRQAAGLTLRPEKLEPFRGAMERWLRANVDPWAYVPEAAYDAPLEFEAVTPGLIAALEGMQPTGFGNPAPLFRAAAEVVEARPVGADGAHLKLTLAEGGHRLDGIAFREGHRAGTLEGGVDALFAVKLNTWMGRSAPQLEVRALADADVSARLDANVEKEPELQCDFLTEIFYNKKIPPVFPEPAEADPEALRAWMEERPQGTLVVTSGIARAKRLLAALGDLAPDVYLGRWPTDARAFNAVCVCPAAGAPCRGYDRIALADVPAWAVPVPEGAALYRLPGAEGLGGKLPDIDLLREAYRALMAAMKRPAWCQTLAQLASLAAGAAGLDIAATAASILAMADMGLFELDLNARPVALRRRERAKADPQASAVWNAMQAWRSTPQRRG